MTEEQQKPAPQRVVLTGKDSPSVVKLPQLDARGVARFRELLDPVVLRRAGIVGLLAILGFGTGLGLIKAVEYGVDYWKKTHPENKITLMANLMAYNDRLPKLDVLASAIARYAGTQDQVDKILARGNNENLSALTDLVGSGDNGYSFDEQITCLAVVEKLMEMDLANSAGLYPNFAEKLAKSHVQFSPEAADKFYKTFSKCYQWEKEQHPNLMSTDFNYPEQQRVVAGGSLPPRKSVPVATKSPKKELRSTSWRRT